MVHHLSLAILHNHHHHHDEEDECESSEEYNGVKSSRSHPCPCQRVLSEAIAVLYCTLLYCSLAHHTSIATCNEDIHLDPNDPSQRFKNVFDLGPSAHRVFPTSIPPRAEDHRPRPGLMPHVTVEPVHSCFLDQR